MITFTSKLRGHLDTRVVVTPLTPELMHTPHNPAWDTCFSAAAADAAASVVYCGLSCSFAYCYDHLQFGEQHTTMQAPQLCEVSAGVGVLVRFCTRRKQTLPGCMRLQSNTAHSIF